MRLALEKVGGAEMAKGTGVGGGEGGAEAAVRALV